MEIICFFAGMSFVYTKSSYAFYLLLITLVFKPQPRAILWFLIAVIWGIIHQYSTSEQGMPNTQVIKNAHLQGYVASIPAHTASKLQFQFKLTKLNNKPANTRILLSCYKDCPNLRAGQYWHLNAKLQQPQNLSNPGGFDYVRWLHARHIKWTGYTYKGTLSEDTSKPHRYPLLRLRQHLANVLEGIDPNPTTLGILQALTLGITTHINNLTWDLFRHTGTTHLMVISGAHIGLIVGLIYALIKWLWCRSSRLCLWIPAPKIASLMGFSMGVLYALLAGFGVPAQRALLMSFFMLLPNFVSQRISVWQSWRYALFLVIIVEPHSVMMPGFYLSFIAVAILILINQRIALKGYKKIISMQLACLAGLMPLTLYWFSYGSINGIFANILAIPWVSFIIVPIGLLITLLSNWCVFPYMVTLHTWSIKWLLTYLHWIDSLSFLNLDFSFTHILSPLALMITIGTVIFIPIGRLLTPIIIIGCAALFPAHQKINTNEALIDVLDVGQGLAIVIHTQKHVIIYDTGMKFYQGGDMGKRVIIPYLKTWEVNHIDKVIISHPDMDHRGGLASIEELYKINELIVDAPKFYKHAKSCHKYPDWTLDGVSFHFFPIAGHINRKNNSSCVLKISTKAGSVLLSGDIEKSAEHYLTSTYGAKLASSILIVPHHGSKTSSSNAFIKQVSPRIAVMSYGFDNRYHFPHKNVTNSYQKKHITIYDTPHCGTVSIHLGQLKTTPTISCYKNN